MTEQICKHCGKKKEEHHGSQYFDDVYCTELEDLDNFDCFEPLETHTQREQEVAKVETIGKSESCADTLKIVPDEDFCLENMQTWAMFEGDWHAVYTEQDIKTALKLFKEEFVPYIICDEAWEYCENKYFWRLADD